MASLLFPKWHQFELSSGAPAASYWLHFLTTGTSTAKDAYSDVDATTPIANPYQLNSAGRPAVNIFISGKYRVVLHSTNDLLTGTSIADVDPVEDGVRASQFQIDAQTYGGNNTGTADALVFAYTPVITSYTNGMILRGRITADNTGAVTINAGGGVKSLVKHNGAALISGDLQGPDILEFVYDSTTDVFRLNTPTYNQLARLDTNQSFTKAQGVNRSALIDAATIAVDASLSNVFTVTLGGNRTLGQPTNPKDGQSITIFITQDGTGSRTLAYHADWLFPGGTDPTLTTTAAAVDVLSAIYNGATTKWYAVLNKAFA